ncbi:glycosyltransferase family 2 protein [Mycolicibacterium sphagni]|uniref:glycosyltransferase family 2 protein n=1 Tax=Mycolicibacterium sphagni TaxID=1786 RepID=UPI0021F2A15B|nr:glycosyltransferase [Mycolicibacterium sphagni]MCV7174884.1 glycosyltransferase [Mycolicibacterium sphagni]
MKVLIGTYRNMRYVPTALESLAENVTGVGELVFIDDSGDAANARALADYGRVVEVDRRGYTAAMTEACKEANGEMVFWLEEDFTFNRPVDLDELAAQLEERPYLAQIVLLRQPVYPGELLAGGVIEHCERVGHRFTEVDGLIEHTAFFSGNPGVWAGAVSQVGWPQTEWSEHTMRHTMMSKGYRFALLPGQAVTHWGEHSGFGY